jgi:hypothetical protein
MAQRGLKNGDVVVLVVDVLLRTSDRFLIFAVPMGVVIMGDVGV